MSEKTECPGCGAYSSTIRYAFQNDEPCPNCGLSANAALEIESVRRSRANEEIKGRLEDALKRADRAETEANSLRYKLDAIKDVLEAEEPE